MPEFVVSSSPHIRNKITTQKIMLYVILALLPATVAGIFFFGQNALWVVLVSVASAVFFEFIIEKIFGMKVTISDLSAAVTGLLLALVLPPNVPLWLPIMGSLFAIGVVKLPFGGLGKNIFNPALAARAFLMASWPTLMTTTWKSASPSLLASGLSKGEEVLNYLILNKMDALTSATPLAMMKLGINDSFVIEKLTSLTNLWHLFIGSVGGTIGETSALLLILGGLFLLVKRIISWHIPVSMLLVIFVFSWIFPRKGVGQFFAGYPLFEILAGGAMIGAFFMATDYVTAPLTAKGKIIYGTLIGFLVVMIRCYGGYPEGVNYAILIMNGFVPLIDRYTRPRIFGVQRK